MGEVEDRVPFRRMLEGLVASIPGATGAILADWEGEAVEQFCLGDVFELKVLAAHKGVILNLIKELHEAVAVGSPREAVITTDEGHVMVGPVGADYALVVTLERRAIVGRALLNFRGVVEALHGEIY
jgi:predicted regulator of Ras-like GTPase activity (Roadblock/LC7/MglB family)